MLEEDVDVNFCKKKGIAKMDFNDDENIEWLMESSKTVENVGENDDNLERDSIELCRFLQVLRGSFENEPILIESKAKGTIRSEDDVQKLIKNLKVLGYFFSIRTSEKKVDRQNCKLMIMNKKTPPSSHPYRVLSHIRYYCSQKHKQRTVSSAQDVKKTRRITNCKAILDIRQVEMFTTVSLPLVKRKRIETLRSFRLRLLSDSPPEGEIKYGVIISLPKTHSHPLQVKGQYLNHEVKAAMHYLLRTGTTSIESIQEKIYQIVDREFENDLIKPSRDNSAFYPNQKTIYNHLRRDGLVVKRFQRRTSPELAHLKRKTKQVLNSVIRTVEDCHDLSLLMNFYNKFQEVAKAFGEESAGKNGVR